MDWGLFLKRLIFKDKSKQTEVIKTEVKTEMTNHLDPVLGLVVQYVKQLRDIISALKGEKAALEASVSELTAELSEARAILAALLPDEGGSVGGVADVG